MERGFREFDHSGDIGIEAWGSEPAELFEQMTLGLFGLMASGRVEERVERRLFASATTPADLVVNWLSEVISSAAARGEVYGGVVVHATSDLSVEGVVRGEAVDPARHALRFDVKAATYHGLLFEQRAGRYRARVIFDL